MKSPRIALLLCSCAFPAVLRAQDFHTALDVAPSSVSFTNFGWQTTGAAGSRDGVDAATSGDIVLSPLGPSYIGGANLRAKFAAPGVVTWWWRATAAPAGYNGSIYDSAPLRASAITTTTTDGPWTARRVEVGPGGTLSWVVQLSGPAPATISNLSTVDQLTHTPLPSVSVEEALDLPGGGWTLSAPDAWQGVQSALASDGADYLWMPPGAPGADSWMERSFTGPARISWKWYHITEDADIRLLVDGVPFMQGGSTGTPNWQSGFADIEAGAHTVRWAAATPASGAVTTVALDSVSTGPALTVADMLGTPGRAWTRGGYPPPWGNAASGDSTHPTVVEFRAASGQQAWVETSVTGPATAQFWVSVTGQTTSFAVKLDATEMYAVGSGDYRLHIPAGPHTLRFSTTGSAGTGIAWLDSFTTLNLSNTPNASLGQPEWPLLEKLRFGSASPLQGNSSPVTVLYPATFSFAAAPLDEPSLISFTHTKPSWEYITMVCGGRYRNLMPGTNTVLIGGGSSQIANFTTEAGGSSWTLSNLTRTLFPRVSLNTALDCPVAMAVSPEGRALGSSGPGWDGTDFAWLQPAASGAPAWLEFSVGVPATVALRFRGRGLVSINGAPAVSLGSENYAEEWTAKSWQVTDAATFRLLTDPATGSAGLFLDALTITLAGPVTLETALETPGWTTGEANPWAGVYDPVASADYAAPVSLHPGGQAWIESTITGSFDFAWSCAAGDSLRLEIDGALRADTALPSASPIRVQVPGGTVHRCRWTALRAVSASGPSPAPPRLWTIDTAPDTRLAQIAQNAFALTEGVFWASDWVSTPGMRLPHQTPLVLPPASPVPVSATSSGSAGLYCSGPGTVKFGASVTVSIPNNMIHGPGEATLTIQGAPVAVPVGENSQPVTASGLSCVVWNGYLKDVIDTNYAISLGEVAVSNVRWLPGNAAWRVRAGALGLTGFAADTTADTDRDGLPAGLEFLLGTDPAAANASPVTLTPVPGAFRLTAPQPAAPVPGATLQLQTSADLTNWLPAPPSALIEDTAASRTWQIPFPAAPARTFFTRLEPVITPD